MYTKSRNLWHKSSRPFFFWLKCIVFRQIYLSRNCYKLNAMPKTFIRGPMTVEAIHEMLFSKMIIVSKIFHGKPHAISSLLHNNWKIHIKYCSHTEIHSVFCNEKQFFQFIVRWRSLLPCDFKILRKTYPFAWLQFH